MGFLSERPPERIILLLVVVIVLGFGVSQIWGRLTAAGPVIKVPIISVLE